MSENKMFVLEMIAIIGIIIFLITAVNSCSASDWNNGICPKCGKEVRRY